MNDQPLTHRQASLMREQGDYPGALSLLRQSLAAAELAARSTHVQVFFVMFEWELLAEKYPPARAALAEVRDGQVTKLMNGDLLFGRGDSNGRDDDGVPCGTRFSLIVEMNRTLADTPATHGLFAWLDATAPDLARQYSHVALPAVVDAGDFSLADRYLGYPLERLADVNTTAAAMPLFPPAGQAPRLAAELMNLTTGVRLGMAIRRGQGRETEAAAWRDALLSGLASDELRALAQQELDQPGAINDAIVRHQMASEEG